MIGIITIYDYNYGNRLQNYAVYKILSKYDQCLNIIYINDSKKNKYIKFRRIKALLKHPTRSINYWKFNKNYILSHKRKVYSDYDFKKLDRYFDKYVLGSDQIWNPNFCNNDFTYYMAGFTHKTKIALAASIGLDKLNEIQSKSVSKYLNGIDFISCREIEGSNILKNLCEKDVQTIIDPTLAISKNEWDMIAKKPSFHNLTEKYVLLYFLGGLSDHNRKKIHCFAQKNHLIIIDLYDYKSKYYSCGPSEFVWMIKNCAIMFTDSFHGCVFSYIYDRPFRVFKRIDGENMNSRLSSLINILQLENKVYINDNSIFDNDLFLIAYDKNILYREQEKFFRYIDTALSS